MTIRSHQSLALVSTLVFANLVLSGCASTPTNTESTGVPNSAIKNYTLKTCIVTDNALGSMGDPVMIVYNGQEVGFCCAPCVEEFEQNPQKFLAKLPSTTNN